MKKLVTLFILLSGCGMPMGSAHKEFIPHIETFTDITGLPANVTMVFTEEDDYIGVCIKYSNGIRKIQINRAYWEVAGENSREQVILHELGHCVLDRDHTETMAEHPDYSYLFPNSVMYPYIFGSRDFYDQFKSHYFEELVDPEKTFLE